MLRSWHYEGYDYALFKMDGADHLSACREDGRQGSVVSLNTMDVAMLSLLQDSPAKRTAKARSLLEGS